MTPRSLLSAGSVTETVLENCSAAYTRSRWLIGTSGAASEPGAWPAQADATARRLVAASNMANSDARLTSLRLVHVHRGVGHCLSDLSVTRNSRGRLVGRRHRRGQRLPDRKPHRGDLLLLRDDDLLGKAPDLLVVAGAQEGLRHLDRA